MAWLKELQSPPMFCGRVNVVMENVRGAVTPRWEYGEDDSGLVADMTMTPYNQEGYAPFGQRLLHGIMA